MDYLAEADVVVVGGGPAGIAAAVSAARCGARTLLIERYGFLGGMSTAALVAPWMTFHAGDRQVIGGIGQEIVDRLIPIGGAIGHVPDTIGFVSTITPYDPELFKWLTQKMLLEAGVRLLMHTEVAGARVNASGRIEAVSVNEAGRPKAVKGKVFIDCSGNGDLLAFSGARWEMGRKQDGLCQPATMVFKVAGVDFALVRKFIANHRDDFALGDLDIDEQPILAVSGFFSHVAQAAARGDFKIPRDRILFFSDMHPGEAIINTSRVVKVDVTSLESLTQAELEGRRQVFDIWAFLRNNIPGFAKCRIVQTGAQIGLREGRRAVGEYVLDEADVKDGREFSDNVARGAFPIDIHSPDGSGLVAAGGRDYGIPYRSLIPKGSVNLLCSGRCLSASHEAHASTRVTPTCFATGQAAGTAAALAVRQNTSVQEVDIKLLQDWLQRSGAILW